MLALGAVHPLLYCRSLGGKYDCRSYFRNQLTAFSASLASASTLLGFTPSPSLIGYCFNYPQVNDGGETQLEIKKWNEGRKENTLRIANNLSIAPTA